MRIVKAGATSQSVYIEVLDSTSTTGGRKTGLAFNTSGLTAYYVKNGAAAVAITLATLASANAAWSSGGFVEVDATNMPGVYRLDVPDAAFSSGASTVVTLKGATGMVQVSTEIQLTALDLQTASVAQTGDNYARIGAPVGASISADIAGVQADTDNMQTRLPAALVSGRMDASVGAYQSGLTPLQPTTAGRTLDVTATGEAGIDWANIGAPTTAVDLSGTTIKNVDNAIANVTTVATTTNLTNAPTAGDFTAVMKTSLNNATPAVTVSDKTGFSLSAAGILAIWHQLTSAIVTSSTIGKLIVDFLDATISSRLASASYTAPDNADILLIKAKTDNLPASPAAVSDIPTVVQNRQEMDSNSTKLANLDAAVSSRSTYAGGAVASVTAPVTVGTNSDKTGYALTAGERTSVADALLDRDMATGVDSGGRTVRSALRQLRNKVTLLAGVLTVYKENDTTVDYTAAITTDASADPITGVDPV